MLEESPRFVPGCSSEMLRGGEGGGAPFSGDVQHILKEVECLRKENDDLKKKLCADEVTSENTSSGVGLSIPQSLQSEVTTNEGTPNQIGDRNQYAHGTKNELIDLLLKKDKVLHDLISSQQKNNDVDTVGAEYEESIRMARAWMEALNLESLSQLRGDLDEDYAERIKIVEEKLRDAYRGRIRRVAETCDQKVTQMKNDYEEEIRKIQESPDFLEETEASLDSGSLRDSSDVTIAMLTKDDTKDALDDHTMTDDEIDIEFDGVSKHSRKHSKNYADKSVTTMSSQGPDSIDFEQDEIIKLKESLAELFRKPDPESEKVDTNIFFCLDDVEGVLQQNYVKITDMTDQLKVTLYSAEKVMRQKFEDEKYELILKAKKDTLRDIASILTDIVAQHKMFVDDKTEEMLAEHGGDLSALMDSVQSDEGNSLVSGIEKSDIIPEKLMRKMEEFFGTGDNFCEVLRSEHSDHPSPGKGKIQKAENMLESPIWKRLFVDDDILPSESKKDLQIEKLQFKHSFEESITVLLNCVNTTSAKVLGQFSQYMNLSAKQKASKDEAEMFKCLACAHTSMVLKNSLQAVEQDETPHMTRKIVELLLAHMDPHQVSEQETLFKNLLEEHNSLNPDEGERERCKKDKLVKEMDELSKSCMKTAVQSLLEVPDFSLCVDHTEDGKKVRFQGKPGEVKANDDEVKRLHDNHKKEVEKLKGEIDATVTKKVKEATDDKMNEFEKAKEDLVKQHQFILDEFIAEQEKEIQDIRKDHSLELEKLRNGFVEQIFELQKGSSHDTVKKSKEDAEIEGEIATLRKNYEEDLAKQSDLIRLQFENEHVANLNILRKQISDDHEEHLRLLTECQEKQMIEMQDLREHHASAMQELQVDHCEEIAQLQEEINSLDDQCGRMGNGILIDEEGIESLRSLALEEDYENDFTSLTNISHPDNHLSRSILKCYEKTQNHLKEQCNSQLDTILEVFNSALEKDSNDAGSSAGSICSDVQLIKKLSLQESVDNILKAGGTKSIHRQIETVFKELIGQCEKWNNDNNTQMETLTHEIEQLKVRDETDAVLLDMEARLERLQRQDEESTNFINILHSDVKKITDERDGLKEDLHTLKENSKEIVETIIRSEELLHEKLDEIIDNQLTGCDLSQYGLDSTMHSLAGKDVADGSLIEMPLNLAAEFDSPDYESGFLSGVSSRFSETVDHFLQVLSLVFSDFKNTSVPQLEEVDEDVIETSSVCSVEVASDWLDRLGEKMNPNLDVTKEIDGIKESISEKDNIIAKLEKTCAHHDDVISNNKVTFKEQQTEIEALKCAIGNQKEEIDRLKEQLIKKQMVMDAKECQLMEMEEQQKKENKKHIAEVEGVYDDKSKEIKDLKDFIESKQVLITELEDQLSKEEKQCVDLKEDLAKQKEKYESDYKQLASDKSKEISAMYKELEETLKEKDVLENVVKSQEASALKLTGEFEKLNALNNTKDDKMVENEEHLRKEIVRLEEDLKKISTKNLKELQAVQKTIDESRNENNSLTTDAKKHEDEIKKREETIKDKVAKLAELVQEMAQQKEKHETELKEISDCKGKEITAIFNELEEKLQEKDALEDVVKSRDATIAKLMEQLNQHNQANSSKDAKIGEREEVMKREIANLQGEINKLTAMKNEELSNTQIALEEISQQKDEVEDLVNLKQAYILKLEEQLKESKVTADESAAALEAEREKHAHELKNVNAKKAEDLHEERHGFEHIIRKQLADIGELDNMKKECEMQIEHTETRLRDIEEELLSERKKHADELANMTKEKNEEIEALHVDVEKIEKHLEDEKEKYQADIENLKLKEAEEFSSTQSIIAEKDNMTETINQQQLSISGLEEQLSVSKGLVEKKQKELSEVQEKLIEELNKNAESLQDMSMDLSEEIVVLRNQLDEGREKHQAELSQQKAKFTALQNSIDQMAQEKHQMEDVLNKQQVYIAELEGQMKKSKSFIDEKQEQLDRIEEQLMQAKVDHARELDGISKGLDKKENENEQLHDVIANQQVVVSELEVEMNQQKMLLEERETQLSDSEKEKEDLVCQFENMACEKDEALASLQTTIEEQAKDKDELELSIESQRALMFQLEEQLNKHKELVESKESQSRQQAEQMAKAKEKEVTDLLNESADLKDMMSSLQDTIDGKQTEQVALNEMLEKEKSFSADLEKQVSDQAGELAALKQQMEKQTTQHLADLEQISIVKDEMIETIQKTLEEQSKEKDEFEKAIDNQYAVIAGLEEQLSAAKKLNDEKIVLLEERGQTIKAKDKSIADLEKEVDEQQIKTDSAQKSLQKIIADLESKRNAVEESLQNKLVQLGEQNEHIINLQGEIDELQTNLEDQEQMLENTSCDLDKSRDEFEKLSLDKDGEIVNIQKKLAKQSAMNDDMNKLLEEQNSQISQTVGELNENKELLAAKQKELREMKVQEEELMQNLTETKDRLVTIKEALEEKTKQETDLNMIIENQKDVMSDLEPQVHELHGSLAARNEELAKLKKALSEEKENNKNMQRELDKTSKDKEGLKSSIVYNETLVDELEQQIEEYKRLLEAKVDQLSESEQSMKDTQKCISEYEEAAAKQKETMLRMEGVLEEEIKENKELKTCVSSRDEIVDGLKKQLNDHKRENEELKNQLKEQMDDSQSLLDDEKKEIEGLKNQLGDHNKQTEELTKQVGDHQKELTQKEDHIKELKDVHAKTFAERCAEFELAASEKSQRLVDVEKQLKDEIAEKQKLDDMVRRQGLMLDELEQQVDEGKILLAQKTKIEKEQEKALENQETRTEQLEKQVSKNKIKLSQQEDELERLNDQIKAFEKLKSELQTACKEKERQISMLEKNISEQLRETDELKDIVKRQQALVCELEEQLIQEKSMKSAKENEIDEMKESLLQRHRNQIFELEKKLNEEKENLCVVERALDARTQELNEAKENTMKQKIKVSELGEQLNEQNILLRAKDHELIEAKERLLKDKAHKGQKWESDKDALLNTMKDMEEKLIHLDYELKKKSEELSELQQTHQEAQLNHINEIMKLNNEHRSQIGTLMEIPQKDRNIKALLMDLQKEADEVLDLVLSVPDVNENTPVERIESLRATWLQEKEMLLSIIDDMRKNMKESSYTEMSNPLSSANVGDITDDEAEQSMASNVPELKHDDTPRRRRTIAQSETSTDTPLVSDHRNIKEAYLHDKSLVSEFERLLNDESKKVETLTQQLEEEIKHKESVQMSLEMELAKVVERELNLKEKYLKVAELLQKEKNAKTRVMEMLNDAQRLNEIQTQNLEEVQNDKNSLLESYTVVSELENMLLQEKEKVDLINTKLEKEKYEKSALQISLDDEKEELKAAMERENSLKEKCIELNKFLLRETEEKKSIAEMLENEKELISMEKKNLEQKEYAMNQRMAKLGDSNPDQKVKTLKAWEEELKKREKSLALKEEKLKSLIKRIEQGYDILPQKQSKDLLPERLDKFDDCSPGGNDWFKQVEGNQLLDTKHLPLVADLNQKINGLQKDKVKLAETLTELKNEIMDYKDQLKDYQDKESKLNAIAASIHPGEKDGPLTADGQKLLNAGWTIAKVQRLYLKYFRAESFRKALVYQKRYLSLMVTENETNNLGGVNNWLKTHKQRPSFKVVVLAVISIRRMKYLVKKYHRNLHKSSPEYQYKDKPRNSSSSKKPKNTENVIDDLDHSPPSSNGIVENGSSDIHLPFHGPTGMKNRTSPSTSTPSSKISSRLPNSITPSKQSHYVPPTTRLTLNDNNNNRSNGISNHSNHIVSPNDRKHSSESGGNRLHINDLSNRHLNNGDSHVSRTHMPNLSLDNFYANDDVPRSYPRPSGIIPDEIPSRINGTHGDVTVGTPKGDKTSPYSNRQFSSPPTPLLSSTSRDLREAEDDPNESLSSYIHTLETLQTRLKQVGYNERTRPSLM